MTKVQCRVTLLIDTASKYRFQISWKEKNNQSATVIKEQSSERSEQSVALHLMGLVVITESNQPQPVAAIPHPCVRFVLKSFFCTVITTQPGNAVSR